MVHHQVMTHCGAANIRFTADETTLPSPENTNNKLCQQNLLKSLFHEYVWRQIYNLVIVTCTLLRLVKKIQLGYSDDIIRSHLKFRYILNTYLN